MSMAKFDIGKGLKRMQESVNSVASAAKNIKLPDVKIPEVKAPDVKKMASDVQGVFKKKEKVEDKSLRVLSTKSAIQIIYYLISADGEISEAEEKRFEEICNELDTEFEKHKDELIASCKKELEKVIDEGDYADVLQDAAEKAILESKPTRDAFITPKLLLWDLLSIAYSDDLYHESERKLLKYLVRKMDIDKAVFLELESSMLTIMDIEKEIDWIKTTNRPYLTIEGMVNELMDRRNVVFESIKDLIML